MSLFFDLERSKRYIKAKRLYKQKESQRNKCFQEIDDLKKSIKSLSEEIYTEEQIQEMLREVERKKERSKSAIVEKEDVEKLLTEKEQALNDIKVEMINSHPRDIIKTVVHELVKKRIKDEKVFKKYINKDTKTVPVLDEFDESGCDIMLFDNLWWMWDREYFSSSFSVSPIVSNVSIGLEIDYSAPTMTEIKKNKYFSLYKYPKRIEPLMCYAKEFLIRNINQKKDSQILIFDKTFEIAGQNSGNRTGYGNYYIGDTLVYEGTKYGETTGYYIIGCLVEKSKY